MIILFIKLVTIMIMFLKHNRNNKNTLKIKKKIIESMLFMFFCTLFTAAGQILFKLASFNLELNFISLITNIYLLMGVFSYCIALIFLLIAFKKTEISNVYPFLALSYIWVSIFAPLIIKNEIMNLNKWLGIIILVIGVALIGFNNVRGEE